MPKSLPKYVKVVSFGLLIRRYIYTDQSINTNHPFNNEGITPLKG